MIGLLYKNTDDRIKIKILLYFLQEIPDIKNEPVCKVLFADKMNSCLTCSRSLPVSVYPATGSGKSPDHFPRCNPEAWIRAEPAVIFREKTVKENKSFRSLFLNRVLFLNRK
jgi:hypothetical protein